MDEDLYALAHRLGALVERIERLPGVTAGVLRRARRALVALATGSAIDDDTAAIASQLLTFADELEYRGADVGDLTAAAQALVSATIVHTTDGCPVCGKPIEQPARGRRRTYCGDRCKRLIAEEKRRSSNMRRNGTM